LVGTNIEYMDLKNENIFTAPKADGDGDDRSKTIIIKKKITKLISL